MHLQDDSLTNPPSSLLDSLEADPFPFAHPATPDITSPVRSLNGSFTPPLFPHPASVGLLQSSLDLVCPYPPSRSRPITDRLRLDSISIHDMAFPPPRGIPSRPSISSAQRKARPCGGSSRPFRPDFPPTTSPPTFQPSFRVPSSPSLNRILDCHTILAQSTPDQKSTESGTRKKPHERI